MALSHLAALMAAEIRQHDWSDAPYRADRAGHNREVDSNRGDTVLDPKQTDFVRMNVMWVAAQVLGHLDPNFDEYEFAEACGVDTRTSAGRPRSGGIAAGIRKDGDGRFCVPGTRTLQ